MNKLFLLVFLIVTCFNSFGQSKIGFKLGENFSNVKNSNGVNFTTLSNFNAGAVAKFKLKEKVFLNTELLLSNKGFNSLMIPNGTTATRLAYLSIPALFEFQPLKRIYFQLGPEFNCLLNANMKNSSLSKDVSESYTKTDFALAGGAGFSIIKRLFIEARYSSGITNIIKSESTSGSYKTRTFQVDVVYFLKSKK